MGGEVRRKAENGRETRGVDRDGGSGDIKELVCVLLMGTGYQVSAGEAYMGEEGMG